MDYAEEVRPQFLSLRHIILILMIFLDFLRRISSQNVRYFLCFLS